MTWLHRADRDRTADKESALQQTIDEMQRTIDRLEEEHRIKETEISRLRRLMFPDLAEADIEAEVQETFARHALRRTRQEDNWDEEAKEMEEMMKRRRR